MKKLIYNLYDIILGEKMKILRARSAFSGKMRKYNVIAEGVSEMGNKMILTKETNQVTNKEMYVIYRWHPIAKGFLYLEFFDSVMRGYDHTRYKDFREHALARFNMVAKGVTYV
jgi:hypothetical protein